VPVLNIILQTLHLNFQGIQVLYLKENRFVGSYSNITTTGFTEIIRNQHLKRYVFSSKSLFFLSALSA
jgi:hypothetical protein